MREASKIRQEFLPLLKGRVLDIGCGDDKVVEELADILIRTLDLYWGLKKDGYTDVSLHDTYLNKTAFNEQRERMHGVLA